MVVGFGDVVALVVEVVHAPSRFATLPLSQPLDAMPLKATLGGAFGSLYSGGSLSRVGPFGPRMFSLRSCYMKDGLAWGR